MRVTAKISALLVARQCGLRMVFAIQRATLPDASLTVATAATSRLAPTYLSAQFRSKVTVSATTAATLPPATSTTETAMQTFQHAASSVALDVTSSSSTMEAVMTSAIMRHAASMVPTARVSCLQQPSHVPGRTTVGAMSRICAIIAQTATIAAAHARLPQFQAFSMWLLRRLLRQRS